MLGRHRHRYSIAAISHATGITQALGLPQTVLLMRCEDIVHPDCVVSKAVAGQWTWHDLDVLPRTWPAELARDEPEEVASSGPAAD